MGDIGDCAACACVRERRQQSRAVGIGHVGGGLPDDAGAVPTAAPPATAPTPNTNPVTAARSTRRRAERDRAGRLGRRRHRAPVTVAVTDKEGNVLGVFKMTARPSARSFAATPASTRSRTMRRPGWSPSAGRHEPRPALKPVPRAAITKAGTAAFFSTQGNAFTPRTAGSSSRNTSRPAWISAPRAALRRAVLPTPLLRHQEPGLPFGLSADPGAVPLYKNGVTPARSASKATGLTRLTASRRFR
jgi:hypothetical protein